MADIRLLAKMPLGLGYAPTAAFDGLQGTGITRGRSLVAYHEALSLCCKDKAMVDSIVRALTLADDPDVRAKPKVIGHIKAELAKEKIVLGPKRRTFLQKYLKVVWKIDAGVDEKAEEELKWRDVLNDLNALFFLKDGQLGNVMQQIIQDHVDRLPGGETKKLAEAYVMERYVNPSGAKSEKMLRKFGIPIEPSTVVNPKSRCPSTWVGWGVAKGLHDIATWAAVAGLLWKIESDLKAAADEEERRQEKRVRISDLNRRIEVQENNLVIFQGMDSWDVVRMGVWGLMSVAEARRICNCNLLDLQRLLAAESTD